MTSALGESLAQKGAASGQPNPAEMASEKRGAPALQAPDSGRRRA
jgi:hypothetical protein